jgi:hypothetical protein
MRHRSAIYRTTFLVLLIAAILAACGDDGGSSTEGESSSDADTADSGGEVLSDGGTADAGADAAGDTGAPDSSVDADGETGTQDDGGGEDTNLPNNDASDDTGQDTGQDAGDDAGDDCTFTPNSTLASGEPADMSGMTAAHNKWRERVGVARVSWNTALAASAKAYAEQCVWQHSSDRSPDAGFNSVGENLAYTSQQLSAYGVENVVDMWADERFDWDFGMTIGDGTFSEYGHYTQVVWHSTTEIGCGAAYCANIAGIQGSGTVIVCRYGPAGNYTGQAPYSESTGVCLDLDNDDTLQGDDADDTDRAIQ